MVLDRLELRHVDAVLADERLDLARASPRILIRGKEPVVKRMGFQPLVQRAARLALIGARRVIHELADEPASSTIP